MVRTSGSKRVKLVDGLCDVTTWLQALNRDRATIFIGLMTQIVVAQQLVGFDASGRV